MRQLPLTLPALLMSLFLLGCSDSTSSSSTPAPEDGYEHAHNESGDHSDHDHPQTLEDGLKELTELRNTVRDAFAADDIDTAHGPLHDVGHLLEDITGLVEKRDLSPEQKELAKQNIESLFDLFGSVDRTLHGQDGTTYSEASEKIDAAIAVLQGIATPDDSAPETAEPSESEGDASPEE